MLFSLAWFSPYKGFFFLILMLITLLEGIVNFLDQLFTDQYPKGLSALNCTLIIFKN